MKIIRCASFILCLLLLLSFSGAYATWNYAESPLLTVTIDVPLEMGIYKWSGSEELPDDEEEGLAHAQLIHALINGEEIGLNSPDSYLNDQIGVRENWGRDYLGSMAITQGSQLNSLFNTGTENVTFLLYWPNNTTYYIFTTSLDLGTNGNLTYPVGSTISPIYRTTVTKENGVWVAQVTEEGYASSIYYKESQLDIFGWATASKIPGFDPASWRASS